MSKQKGFFSTAKKSDAQLQKELTRKLGAGPMRFGPVRQECSVQDEAEAQDLSWEDIKAFAAIKSRWDVDFKKQAKQKNYTNTQILRFAVCSDFNEDRTLELLYKTSPRHFQMTAFDLDLELRSQRIFPIPELKTREGKNVLYIRPSTFSPRTTSTDPVIDNLSYVMNSMKIKDPCTGLTAIVNMDDWIPSDIKMKYFSHILGCLIQDHSFPTKVDQVLIVNPPISFGREWDTMKPVVQMIMEVKLGEFFEPGYEDYMPTDFSNGNASTEELVRDYVSFQQNLEKETNQNFDLFARGGSILGAKLLSPQPPRLRFGFRRTSAAETVKGIEKSSESALF
jgi:hypothetical protein